MASDIYKIVKGEKVYLTDREIKAYIMEQRGWSSAQYNKEYDKLRNRVKNYEAFKRASGVEPKKIQSARDILYKETKAMARYGADYVPSNELQMIRSFSSASTTKFTGGIYTRGKRQSEEIKGILQSPKQLARLQAEYKSKVLRQFDEFIKFNPKAAEIAKKIQDPVKMERALADFADKLHDKIRESIKAQKNAAIPFGDVVGSDDDDVEFEISKYL